MAGGSCTRKMNGCGWGERGIFPIFRGRHKSMFSKTVAWNKKITYAMTIGTS